MHGGRGNAQDLRRLVVRESTEVVKFDCFRLAFIQLLQTRERVIEFDQVSIRFGREQQRTIEGDAGGTAASFGTPSCLCVIDQDAPHDARGDGKEMGPTRPLHIGIDESEKGFVDERSGLQRVAGIFGTEVPFGQAVEFVVDVGEKLVARNGVTLAPGEEEATDRGRVRHAHAPVRGKRRRKAKCRAATRGPPVNPSRGTRSTPGPSGARLRAECLREFARGCRFPCSRLKPATEETMSINKRCTLFIVLAWAVCTAPVAAQRAGSARSGFAFSVGLGRGSTGVTCEDCSIEIDERINGLTGYVRLGGFLTPRLLFGVEGSGWLRNSDGLERRIAAVSFVLVGYPSASAGFFVRSGAGVIRAVIENPLIVVVGEGVTWNVGIGYDIGAGAIALTPFVTWLNSVEVAANVNDISTGVNLNPNFLQAGLAITIR